MFVCRVCAVLLFSARCLCVPLHRVMPMCCGQLKSDSLSDIDAASSADLAPLDTDFWSKQQEELSSQGLRVLALCRLVQGSHVMVVASWHSSLWPGKLNPKGVHASKLTVTRCVAAAHLLVNPSLDTCSTPHHPPHHTTNELNRGDLQPGEDPGDFCPNRLRKRTPSLALVALFAILDPPREEAIEAAKIAHTAGITVKMITGW